MKLRHQRALIWSMFHLQWKWVKMDYTKGYLRKSLLQIVDCFVETPLYWFMTLQWRHNGHDGISIHQPHNYLLNCLFRKHQITGPYAGNSPVTGEFPAQMATNAKNVSIWWRHHAYIRHNYTIPINTIYLPWLLLSPLILLPISSVRYLLDNVHISPEGIFMHQVIHKYRKNIFAHT